MKHQRLIFPVIGYKIRGDGLLRVSSIVFIFETIFVQLSYTRRAGVCGCGCVRARELKSIAESTLL